jgi:hypothetical protein
VLEREDIDRLKEIFVTRQECDNTTDEINRKLANDSTRLAVIETKISWVLWLCGAICGGIIAMLIKMFFGG